MIESIMIALGQHYGCLLDDVYKKLVKNTVPERLVKYLPNEWETMPLDFINYGGGVGVAADKPWNPIWFGIRKYQRGGVRAGEIVEFCYEPRMEAKIIAHHAAENTERAVTDFPPILMVEDTHDDQVLARILLGGLCNPLVIEETVYGAWAWITSATELPIVVLLDLGLPDADGLTLLVRIRNEERMKAMGVLILTASDDPEDYARALKVGANGYLVKPADPNKLVLAVCTAMHMTWGIQKSA